MVHTSLHRLFLDSHRQLFCLKGPGLSKWRGCVNEECSQSATTIEEEEMTVLNWAVEVISTVLDILMRACRRNPFQQVSRMDEGSLLCDSLDSSKDS